MTLIPDYVENHDESQEKSLVQNAYVVFRSMEGAARFTKAYDISYWSRCLLKSVCRCCSCKDKKEYQRKLFRGKYLSVKPAVEPSLIHWENIGITKC